MNGANRHDANNGQRTNRTETTTEIINRTRPMLTETFTTVMSKTKEENNPSPLQHSLIQSNQKVTKTGDEKTEPETRSINPNTMTTNTQNSTQSENYITQRQADVLDQTRLRALTLSSAKPLFKRCGSQKFRSMLYIAEFLSALKNLLRRSSLSDSAFIYSLVKRIWSDLGHSLLNGLFWTQLL